MIIKHTCSNGVRIVVEKIPTVRSVAIGIWINVGSRYETKENNGISHLIEHMLFKGTKHRNAREIAVAFDAIGGQVNAFTSKEYTCLYAKVLDEKAEYALELLSDMFFHSVFDEEELHKERNVVLEEIKMYEDAPDGIVHDMLSSARYGDHPLALSILGTEHSLRRIERKDLINYKNKFYTPENIVISIAGNIQEDFIHVIDQKFGRYETTNELPIVQKPKLQSRKLTKKKDTEQAHLCLGYTGLPYGDDRLSHVAILNNILGGSMSSRLFQDIREERGLAYSVFSYHSSYQDSGMLTIYAGTAPEQVDLLYETILKTVAHVRDKGVTEQELQNSKAQLKGNLMLSLESTNSRMSRNGRNELMTRKQRTLDDIIAQLDRVTIVDLNDIAQRLLNGEFASSLISPSGKHPSH